MLPPPIPSSKSVHARLPFCLRRLLRPRVLRRRNVLVLSAVVAVVVLFLVFRKGADVNTKFNDIRRGDFRKGNADIKESEDASPFRCASTGRGLASHMVNDEYCDCVEDGSDEWLTSACSSVDAKPLFLCRDKTVLAPSRVGDGVCDCCDGADEIDAPQEKFDVINLDVEAQAKIGRFAIPCPNKCAN